MANLDDRQRSQARMPLFRGVHGTLLRRHALYGKWHGHKYHQHVHAGVFLAYVLGTALVVANALALPGTSLAVNDTSQTWQFNASTASSYTYDPTVAVDNGGARPVSNLFSNPSFGSGVAGWSAAAIAPAGWVEIPGSSTHGTGNFLAMKYEAKCASISDPAVGLTSFDTGIGSWPNNTQPCTAANGRLVVSTPTGYPIANFTQNQAATLAQSVQLNGSTGHLMTNDEWMTIARNVEAQPANWSEGAVGSGYLFAGHNDSAPAHILQAVSGDTGSARCAYTDAAGTDPAPGSCPTNTASGTSGTAGNQVRTAVLSNGSVIWDLAGNIHEELNDRIAIVDEPDIAGQTGGAFTTPYEFPAITSFGALTRDDVNPAGLSYDSSHGMGRYYGHSQRTELTTMPFVRGGAYSDGLASGMFALGFWNGLDNAAQYVGFRVASDPVNISQSYVSDAGRSGGATVVSVGTVADAKLSQAVTTGDAASYGLVAFVRDRTPGHEGGTVDASVASLMAGGVAVSSSYENAGNGWWKLSATVTGSVDPQELGVAVKAGKTVAVDDLTLSNPSNSYFIYTTAAYENALVESWDSLTPSASLPGASSIRYQICTDDGSACESGSDWTYWNGSAWVAAANLTAHTNAVSELTLSVMRQLPTDSRKISVKAIFVPGAGDAVPILNSLQVGLTTDVTAPTAPGGMAMKAAASGTSVSSNGWTNGVSPYFSWNAATDEGGGSGLKGYCLYLGTDGTADPATTKGLLGTGPASSAGTSCLFVTSSTSIDLADTALRGGTWLTSSNAPYYLVARAVDNAGNMSTPSAFQFRFDDTPPASSPGFVSVSPAGYSAANDFTFIWPTSGSQVAQDAHSGLAGYQWKTGATSGPYSDWSSLTADGEVDPSDPAYQQGANNFYVRAVDQAGNVSGVPTATTFYYAGSAPTAPQSLTVSPSTSEGSPSAENSFSFSWAAPVTSASPIKQYRYSVNLLPTASNTAAVAGTGLDADAYATQQGKNTLYIVAEDEAGNVNYDAHASVDFYAVTPAPGTPTNLAAVDGSNRDAQEYKVFLTWVEPAAKGTGFEGYEVYRAPKGGEFTLVGTTSGTTYADTGLESREYTYQVRARDNAGQRSVVSAAVSIVPTGRFTVPPALVGAPSVDAKAFGASVSWETDREGSTILQYGRSKSDLDEEAAKATELTKKHLVDIRGLEPDTTYYYKALWIDRDGNRGESDIMSFKTGERPSISDVKVSGITLTSAIVSWTSTTVATSSLNYGKGPGYGMRIDEQSGSQTTNHAMVVTGLEDSTLYHFQVAGTDADGNPLRSDDYTFSTLTRPVVSNLRFESIADAARSSVRLTWSTNVPATSVALYTDQSGKQLSASKAEYVTEHEVEISGLVDQSSYILQAKSVDRYGNEAVSDQNAFMTPDDTRPPKVSNLNVEVRSSGSGPSQKAQLVVSWETDEPSSSQVEFGPGIGSSEYPQATREDRALTTSHVVIVSELEPAKIYHIRAVSRDRSGNQSASADTTAITGKVQRSVVDLIVGSLERSFSFLGKLRWNR